MTIDYTGIASYRSCPEKFRAAYLLKRSPVTTSDALSFGSGVHEGLAEWHRGGVVGTDDICVHNFKEFADFASVEYRVPHDCARCRAIAAFVKAAQQTQLVNLPSSSARSIPHGMNLLWHYARIYGAPHAQFKPLILQDTMKPAVELMLTTEILPWLTFKGTVDMAAKEVLSGRPVGVEHKTTYYLNQAFLNRARLNDQVSGYIYLLQQNVHPDVTSICWNALQTAHKKLTTSPEECFARTTTRRSDAQLDEWKQNLIITAERIREDIERDLWQRTMPDACVAWNSMCAFADSCNAPKSERAMVLEENYIHNEWEGTIIDAD